MPREGLAHAKPERGRQGMPRGDRACQPLCADIDGFNRSACKVQWWQHDAAAVRPVLIRANISAEKLASDVASSPTAAPFGTLAHAEPSWRCRRREDELDRHAAACRGADRQSLMRLARHGRYCPLSCGSWGAWGARANTSAAYPKACGSGGTSRPHTRGPRRSHEARYPAVQGSPPPAPGWSSNLERVRAAGLEARPGGVEFPLLPSIRIRWLAAEGAADRLTPVRVSRTRSASRGGSGSSGRAVVGGVTLTTVAGPLCPSRVTARKLSLNLPQGSADTFRHDRVPRQRCEPAQAAATRKPVAGRSRARLAGRFGIGTLVRTCLRCHGRDLPQRQAMTPR